MIWLSPFASHPSFNLIKKEKDVFLRNDEGKIFEGLRVSFLDILSRKYQLRPIDPTNEKYRNYMEVVLKHFVNLGFKLFKLDYNHTVCLSTNYKKDITRAQALRSGVEFIREQIGPDSHLLTAISPMSPLVGIVDSARTGKDILFPRITSIPLLNSIVNNKLMKRNVKNNKIRKFMNKKLWLNDPDCLLFRDNTGINEKLLHEHKKFIINNNLSLWIGESLSRRKELKKIMKFFQKV